jgi:ABC-2 type transport system ATP-binding protein
MKALQINNLKKEYKDGAVQAVQEVTFSIDQGDFFALLGPNGAGKSTTINCIAQLVNPTSGTIQVLGHDTKTHSEEAKECIGLVPQEFNFNIFEKVFDILVDQAGYYGIPSQDAKVRAEYLLKRLDLWEKRGAQSMTLSGGMKRKLMIARALVHEPKVVLLDEPSAGVDVETRQEMWEFLNELNAQGTTIILTTHYLEEAEQLCKNIAIINHGTVVENTSMKKLLTRMSHETFILDVRGSIDTLEGISFVKKDDDTIEVTADTTMTITEIINTLKNQGVEVLSLRNKQNRLEQLFIELTKKHDTV